MTRNVSVGVDPSNLIADASLTVGDQYVIEVVRGSSFVRMWEGATAPTDRSYFHALAPTQKTPIRPAAGMGIWLWRGDPDRVSRVVVTDNV